MGANELNVPYHDEEWAPVHDQHKCLSFLTLEGAQAGLRWDTILKKRARSREVIDGFNPKKMARYGKKKVLELLRDAGPLPGEPGLPGCFYARIATVMPSKLFEEINNLFR